MRINIFLLFSSSLFMYFLYFRAFNPLIVPWWYRSYHPLVLRESSSTASESPRPYGDRYSQFGIRLLQGAQESIDVLDKISRWHRY